MDDSMTTVEAATQALAATAERAARLMRQETQRAQEEASRARREIQSVKEDLAETRSEILATRGEIQEVRKEIRSSFKGEDQRFEKSAKLAWGAVGVMGLAVVIAVGWTAAKLTRTDSELGHISGKLTEFKTTAEQRAGELARLREQAEIAKIAAAKAEGQLQVYSQERLTSINDRSNAADDADEEVIPQFEIKTPEIRPEPKIDLKLPEVKVEEKTEPQATEAAPVEQKAPAAEEKPASPAPAIVEPVPAIANKPVANDQPVVNNDVPDEDEQ